MLFKHKKDINVGMCMLYAYVYIQLMLTIITKILVKKKSGIFSDVDID